LLLDNHWETADRGTAQARLYEMGSDTTFVSFEGDRRPFQTFHLRMRWPLGSRGDFVSAAEWGGRREKWKGLFRGEIFSDDLLQQQGLQAWRDAWKAGGAASFPVGELDRLILSASWASSRTPGYRSRPGMVTHRMVSRRDGAISISAEERVWRDLTVLAGLRRGYIRDKTIQEGIVTPDLASAEMAIDERIGQKFSWGLAWNWKGLRATAVLSNTLRLDAPIAALDLGYRF